ncbi:hypothetical protein BC941DRAFT_437601 [Chlamydoabsidia padenii]|nr:hypothetical protein BC941DRAFT_437601 [Chlamydoabsidia padenii]
MSAIPTDWTTLERLLLAQAVNKYGENDWTQVARTLKQHPLLHGQARLEAFTQKNCSLQYYHMLENLDNESRRQQKAPNTVITQDIPKVVKLARHLYFQRIDELMKAIKDDEGRFMAILSEIDDIKSGAMDQKLANLTNDQQDSSKPANTENMEQHGDDTHETVDNSSNVVIPGVETTKTPAAETLLSMEPTTTDIIPQQDTKEETNVDTVGTPASSPQKAMETTPTPSTHMDKVDTSEKSDTYSTTIDPATTDSPSAPLLHEHNNTSSPEPQSHALGGVEENDKNMDISSNMVVIEVPSDNQAGTTTITDEEPVTEAPLSIELGTKRLTDDTDSSSMDQPTPSELSSKRPRLEHLMNDQPLSPVSSFYQESTNVTVGKDTMDQVRSSESDIASHIPAMSSPSPQPIATISPQAPSSPTSAQVQPESRSEWTHKSIPEIESTEPTPVTDAEPVQQLFDTTHLTDNKQPWATDGDDGTESDSNTATPTTTMTTTITTPTPEKRRSGSVGVYKDDQRQKTWQKHINLLWRDIANHKNGTMFMNPIKEAQAPLYYNVVKRPLDLKSIKNRIRDGIIRTTVEFERDVVLMLTNSLMYNKEGTEIYQMAWEMLQDVTEQIKIFKTAYGDSSVHTRSTTVLVKDQQKSPSE